MSSTPFSFFLFSIFFSGNNFFIHFNFVVDAGVWFEREKKCFLICIGDFYSMEIGLIYLFGM